MITHRVSLLLVLLAAFAHVSRAQETTRAKTDTGKEVILYADGTWKYVPEAGGAASAAAAHNKSATARKLFKTDRGSFGIWYDESKWREVRAKDADDKAHFSFLAGDAYVMVIAEELAVPITSLRNLAIENAKLAAPDAKMTKEERRIVNGKEILMMKIEGTVEQIPFIYYGYYYGGKEGTIQIVGFTGQNLFAKYEFEFTKFLDGLEIY